MSFVNNKITFCLFLILSSFWGISQQKNSEKLMQQQKQLENDIKQTKILLQKTSSDKAATLNNLSVLENQLKSREALLQNYDQQIRSTELQMDQKSTQITSLEQKISKLKEQYRQLLIYVYKNKIDGTNKMMYLFSAHSYYEAFKRNEYLQKIAEIQQKQRELILQHQDKLSTEIKSLADEKTKKQQLLGQKKEEKAEIEKDKVKVQEVASQLAKEETTLLAKVRADERRKVELQNKINDAIRREIAEEERKRKEAERIAAAKKASEEAKSKPTENKTTATKTEAKTETKTETKSTPAFSASKDLALDRTFETNKGKLPLPVVSGAITGNYGRQNHPFLKDVVTNNNGIDITTSKHAQVRAIFEGEVSSVFSMPGIGKIVIIKHGNYRSVYSNLQEVYVTTGTKVSTKQAIGSLNTPDGENTSILHFEIHQVVNSTVVKQNPSLWIAK
jgi:septal ring factor EnvC (AmiA/AmiB activator)